MSTTTYGTALQGAAPDSADLSDGAPQDDRTGEARTAAAPRPASAAPGDSATRVYRGRSVDALIEKIQSELGADAIVVRHHKGLTGGIAGFFQRPFVEIEARPGTPRVDRYDDGEPALPAALAPADLAQVPARPRRRPQAPHSPRAPRRPTACSPRSLPAAHAERRRTTRWLASPAASTHRRSRRSSAS